MRVGSCVTGRRERRIMRAMATALEDLVGRMTVAELALRSGRSVEAIAAFALGGTAKASTRASANGEVAKPQGRAGGRRASVQTRTIAGRTEFDDRVLDAVRSLGGSAQSKDIQRLVGGTTLQRRVALKRLVQSRKLTRSGNTAATTYTLR
jgi:hypothetical protein